MAENGTPIEFPDELVEAVRSARRVTVLTGAGISAESGIPTFRDSQTGLWAQFDPQELATPEAFASNPKLVMDWYRWRRSLIHQASPNPGHHALAALEQRIPEFTLITQNVDGLHRAAGSRNVIELHGNIHNLRCSTGKDHGLQPWDESELPSCPSCGELLRPDVVWFGEALAVEALERAVEATHSSGVFLTVGTSGIVEPAASLPYEALRAKAVVVEINPFPTPLTVYVRYHFPNLAGQALPELVSRLS